MDGHTHVGKKICIHNAHGWGYTHKKHVFTYVNFIYISLENGHIIVNLIGLRNTWCISEILRAMSMRAFSEKTC